MFKNVSTGSFSSQSCLLGPFIQGMSYVSTKHQYFPEYKSQHTNLMINQRCLVALVNIYLDPLVAIPYNFTLSNPHLFVLKVKIEKNI